MVYCNKILRGRKLRRRIRCKTLTLILPSQQAKSGPPLTPILGQSGINAVQFCTFFNKYTLEEMKDEPLYFPLNTMIGILGGNKFLLSFKKSSLTFLLYNYWLANGYLSVLNLYKVYLIKNVQNCVTVESFFGTFRSLQIQLKRYKNMRRLRSRGLGVKVK